MDEDLEALSDEVDDGAPSASPSAAQGRAPLTARYGPAVWNVDAGDGATASRQTWRMPRRCLAPGDDAGAKLLALQKQLRGWAADTQKRLPGWQSELRTLEKWLGLTLPPAPAPASRRSPRSSTTASTRRRTRCKLFLRLTHLCHSDHPPERTWINDAAVAPGAQELIAGKRPDFAEYRQNRHVLLETYTEELFELELDRIAEGYAGPYQSWFRFFNGSIAATAGPSRGAAASTRCPRPWRRTSRWAATWSP